MRVSSRRLEGIKTSVVIVVGTPFVVHDTERREGLEGKGKGKREGQQA